MGDRLSSRAIQLGLGLAVAVAVAACGHQPAPPPVGNTPASRAPVPVATAPPLSQNPIAVPASPSPPPSDDPALLPEGGKQGEGTAN
jgi:hypothetical protein